MRISIDVVENGFVVELDASDEEAVKSYCFRYRHELITFLKHKLPPGVKHTYSEEEVIEG